MIKILYTINFLNNSGPVKVLLNIIKSLDKKTFDITILTLIDENSKDIVKKLKDNRIKVIELNYKKKLIEILKNMKTILDLVNMINPDIIHTHGIVSTIILKSKKVRAKKITTIHNNMFEDYKYTYGNIKGRIYAYIHIFVLKSFDNVICCSKTSYNILKKYITNTKYIRNGITIERKKELNIIRNKIRTKLNIKDDSIIYIYGGVITSRKRVVELVDLFNKELRKNEYLIIVGNGKLCQKAIKAKKCERIIFTGFKNNIIDYFQSADIYVSYSSSEGFSISVIEALECGLLLLLSDIPSHKECFEIDRNYYIGECFNKSNFTIKKEKISKKLQAVDFNKIREFQRRYLSSDSMARKYEKIYRG